MVATVVVTYNRLAMLKDLIETLKQQTYADNKIVVVNNGSTDGTADWLASQNDLIVINQGNVGGAGGFFTGMKYAAEQGYDYCWVMDDDVLCPPTALADLMRVFEVCPDAGFACSRVIGLDGNSMNVALPTWRKMPDNRYPDTFDLVLPDGFVTVEAATFVSVLVPTARIFEAGLPLRQFFIWGDDTEYTLRFSHSWPCYIACKSVVTHRRAVQGTLSFLNEKDPRRLKNYFYFFRNQAVYNRRWQGRWESVKVHINNLRSLASLAVRLDFAHARILAKAIWAGFWFDPAVEYPEKN